MQPCKQATVWGGFAPDCPVGTGGVMAGALFTSPLPEALAHTVSMAGPHHRARCMAGSAPHPGRARGPVWGPGGRIVTMAGSREGGHLSPTLPMLTECNSRLFASVEVYNAETYARSEGRWYHRVALGERSSARGVGWATPARSLGVTGKRRAAWGVGRVA